MRTTGKPFHLKLGMTECLPDGSRMSREAHVRFCERPAVQFRRPTLPTNIRSQFRTIRV